MALLGITHYFAWLQWRLHVLVYFPAGRNSCTPPLAALPLQLLIRGIFVQLFANPPSPPSKLDSRQVVESHHLYRHAHCLSVRLRLHEYMATGRAAFHLSRLEWHTQWRSDAEELAWFHAWCLTWTCARDPTRLPIASPVSQCSLPPSPSSRPHRLVLVPSRCRAMSP